MTEEEKADCRGVWEQVTELRPKFKPSYDITNNYHAVREIVLGGSMTWRLANTKFTPHPGARVMDIGANVGIYTFWCAAEGAEVAAFEPSKACFEKMAFVIEEHPELAQRITLTCAAVSTATGSEPFLTHISKCGDEEDRLSYNGSIQTDGVVWTPDDFAHARWADTISFEHAIGDEDWDMVKMDIEGAETEILLATPAEVFERIRFMYVEFHPWCGRELHRAVIEKLKALTSFEGYTNENTGEIEAGYCARNLRKVRQ